jgi:membrane-bound serine protease (ClpP class)
MNDIYRTLGIEEPEVIPIPMVGKENFLHTILNPNIAYILLIIGTLGIIMELANPGAIAPGVFGGISLVLAFFAFSVLTINISGIFLILLGVFLILLDVWVTPGIGVLTAGGSISLFFGSLLLYNIESGIHLNIEMILIALFILIGFSIFLLTMVVKAMKKKKTMGVESIIGKNGWVQKDINPEGFVVIDGELWSARSDTPILKGEEVIILKKVEHYLIVTRKGGQEK